MLGPLSLRVAVENVRHRVGRMAQAVRDQSEELAPAVALGMCSSRPAAFLGSSIFMKSNIIIGDLCWQDRKQRGADIGILLRTLRALQIGSAATVRSILVGVPIR